jgi:Ca2+-binding EF-hand superfamily protein
MSQQQGGGGATLEDYKKYVKELKMRIKQLTEKNKSVIEEGGKASNGKTQGNIVSQSIKMTKKAITIQKYVRGFLARKKFARSKSPLKTRQVREIDSKKIQSEESTHFIQRMAKEVEKLGLNMEMLFRSCDSEYKNEVTVEEFKQFLTRLKVKFAKKDIDQLLYFADEDGTGSITREEFCSTLFAFGVASEKVTREVARDYLNATLQNFQSEMQVQSIRIEDYFTKDEISHSEFLNFVSNVCESTDSKRFKEKERYLLMNHFDRQKRGFISRRFLMQEISKISNLDQTGFREESVEATRSALKIQRPHSGSPGPSALARPVSGGSPLMMPSQFKVEKPVEPRLLKDFSSRLEHSGKTLDSFFEFLAEYILKNLNIVEFGEMKSLDFKLFLTKEYSLVFGGEFIDPFVDYLTSLKSSKKASTGSSSQRLSSKIGSSSNNKRSAERADSNRDTIDLIEFKTKLLASVNKKLENNKFMKTMFLSHLHDQRASVEDYFAAQGVSVKKKVDFSEFFKFCQKFFDGSFHEYSSYFEQLDPCKTGSVGLHLVINDLNALKKKPNGRSDQPNSASLSSSFDSIKRKVTAGALDLLERVLKKIQDDCLRIDKEVDQQAVQTLIRSSCNGLITEDEIQTIINSIDISKNGHIEVYELLDFILRHFAMKEEVLLVYIRVLAGYIDKRAENVSTSDYFKKLKVHPQGFYERNVFVKKFQELFGFTRSHCEMFAEAFREDDTDAVSIENVIRAIDKFRRKAGVTEGDRKVARQVSDMRNVETNEPAKDKYDHQEAHEKEKKMVKAPSIQSQVTAPMNREDSFDKSAKKPPSKPEFTKKSSNIEHHEPSPKTPTQPLVSEQRGKMEQPPSKKELPSTGGSKVTEKKIEPSPKVEESVELRPTKFAFNLRTVDDARNRLKEFKDDPDFMMTIRNLNKMMFGCESKTVNLLNFRIHLKSVLEEPHERLIVQSLKLCDTNKNGNISLQEWKDLVDGVLEEEENPVKPVRKQIDVILSSDKYIEELTGPNREASLPLEILNEFYTEADEPIPLIKVKRTVKEFCQEDIQYFYFMKLLLFLDDDRNGFVSFDEIRHVLLIANLNKFSEEGKKFDPYLLLQTPFDEGALNQMSTRSSNSKHLLKRNSCELSKVSVAELDLFLLSRGMLGFFKNNQKAVKVLKIIINNIHSKGSGKVSYSELIKIFEIEKEISKHELILSKSDKKEALANEILLLRRKLYVPDAKPDSYALNKGLLSSALKTLFNLDSLSNNDLQSFELFIRFVPLGKYLSANGGSSLSLPVKDLKSHNSVSKQLDDPVNMRNLLETVKERILESKCRIEEINVFLKEGFGSKGGSLNILSLKKFIEKVKINLGNDHIHVLISHLKSLENDEVPISNLSTFLNALIPKKAVEKVVEIAKNDQVSKAEFNLTNYFSRLPKLGQNDFYQSSSTILNSVVAALQRAFELVLNPESDVQKNMKGNKLTKFFEDPDFGPNSGDLEGVSAFFANVEEPDPNMPSPVDLTWLRPYQISKEEPPVFVHKGAEANDVLQGELGDCWFISSMSLIASDDNILFSKIDPEKLKERNISDETIFKLISGVYPPLFHIFAKYGLYVFRFFLNFEWKFVIIDDRLPCYDSDLPTLAFAQCNSRSEFWVPLIEKAYAKLNGCYQALISGQVDDGVIDMTGLTSKRVSVLLPNKQFNVKALASPEKLWEALKVDMNSKSMMGCSIVGEGIESKVIIDGQKVGLIAGHAYGITDLVELKDYKLLRIRNPWGTINPVEWNGAWSDNSKELISNLAEINKKIKEAKKEEAEEVLPESADGSFFMEFNEFIKIWDNINICKNFPDHWSGLRFRGEWTSNNSGGTPIKPQPELLKAYAQNPQFVMKLKSSKETSIFISLAQEDGRSRSKGTEEFPFPSFISSISLMVFELDEKETKLSCFDSRKAKSNPFLINSRNLHVELILKAGKYVIIPSTKTPGVFIKYFLGVYFDCNKEQIDLYDADNIIKPEIIAEEEESIPEYDPEFKKIIFDISKGISANSS